MGGGGETGSGVEGAWGGWGDGDGGGVVLTEEAVWCVGGGCVVADLHARDVLHEHLVRHLEARELAAHLRCAGWVI